MSKKRSFQYNGETVDVEEQDVLDFIKAAPEAQEVKSYILDGDTVDVAMPDVKDFEATAKNATPLYSDEEVKKKGSASSGSGVPTDGEKNPYAPNTEIDYSSLRKEGLAEKLGVKVSNEKTELGLPAQKIVEEPFVAGMKPKAHVETSVLNKLMPNAAALAEKERKASVLVNQFKKEPVPKGYKPDDVGMETYVEATNAHMAEQNADIEKFIQPELQRLQQQYTDLRENDAKYQEAMAPIKQQIDAYSQELIAKAQKVVMDNHITDPAKIKEMDGELNKAVNEYAKKLEDASPELKERNDFYNDKINEGLDAFVKNNYKPKTKYFGNGEPIEPFIGAIKSESFSILSQNEKKAIIASMWDKLNTRMQQKGIPQKTIDEAKQEFMWYAMDAATHNENGGISQFALREMATKMKGALEEEYKVSEEQKKKAMQELATLPREEATKREKQFNAIFDKNEKLKNSIANVDAVLSTPDGDINKWLAFGKGFASEAGLPFIKSLNEISTGLDTYRISQKILKKQPLTPEEATYMKTVGMADAIKAEMPRSAAYNAGAGLSASLVFWGEFALLSPVGSIAESVSANTLRLGLKGAGNKVKQLAYKEMLATQLAQAPIKFTKPLVYDALVVKPLSTIIGATAQTLANPIRVTENTIRRMTPQALVMFSPEVNDLVTELNTKKFSEGYRTGHNEPLSEALPRGFAEAFTETFTEKMFSAAKGVTDLAAKGLMTRLAKDIPTAQKLYVAYMMSKYKLRVDQVDDYLLKNGIDIGGFGEEIGEEISANGLQPWLTGDGRPFGDWYDPKKGINWETVKETATVIGLQNVLFKTLGAAATMGKGGYVDLRVHDGQAAFNVPISQKGFDFIGSSLKGKDKEYIKAWAATHITSFSEKEQLAVKALINHLAKEKIFQTHKGKMVPDIFGAGQQQAPPPGQTPPPPPPPTPEQQAAEDFDIKERKRGNTGYTIQHQDGTIETPDDQELLEWLAVPANLRALEQGQSTLNADNPSDEVSAVLVEFAKHGSAIATPDKAVTAEKHNGKYVKYKGELGIIHVDEGGKITVETPDKIYDIQGNVTDDLTEHGIEPINARPAGSATKAPPAPAAPVGPAAEVGSGGVGGDVDIALEKELNELGQKQLTKGFNSLSEATKPEQAGSAIVNIEQNKKQGARLSKEQEQQLSEAKAKLKEQGYEIVDYNIVRRGENTIVQGVDFYDNQKDVLTEEQANAIESRINSLEKRGEEVNVDDLPSPVSRTIKPLIKKDGKMVQAAEVNTLIFESVEQAKEAIIKSKEAGYKKPTAADKIKAKAVEQSLKETTKAETKVTSDNQKPTESVGGEVEATAKALGVLAKENPNDFKSIADLEHISYAPDESDFAKKQGVRTEYKSLDDTELTQKQKDELDRLGIKPLNSEGLNVVSRGDSRKENIDFTNIEDDILGNIIDSDAEYIPMGKYHKENGKAGLGLGMYGNKGNWAAMGVFVSPRERAGKGYPLMTEADISRGGRAFTKQYNLKKGAVIISKADAEKISPYEFKNKEHLKEITKKFKDLGIDGIYDRGELLIIDPVNNLTPIKTLEEGRSIGKTSYNTPEAIADSYHRILGIKESDRTERQKELVKAVEQSLKEAPQAETKVTSDNKKPTETPPTEEDVDGGVKAIGNYNPKFKAAKKIIGEETTIEMPNGETREAEYMVVESDDILASHNEISFNDTEGFPKTKDGRNANSRNYKEDSAKLKVKNDARNLKSSIVISDQATTDGGVPIISEDGIVVSGNGRTMAIKLSQNIAPEKYEAYKADLLKRAAKFGIDPNEVAKMKKPILVKVDKNVKDYSVKTFDEYNGKYQKEESPIDKAIKRSSIIQNDVELKERILSIIGRHETMSDLFENRADRKELFDVLVANDIILRQETPKYVEKNGEFTGDGKDLINDILIATILSPETLEATNNVKAFRNKIINALPVLSVNYKLGNNSLEAEVNDAIMLQSRIAAMGLQDDFWKHLRQMGMFDAVNPNTVIINRMINNGAKDFKKFVVSYNKSMEIDENNLFGGDVVLTKQQIIDNLKESNLNEDEKQIIANLEELYAANEQKGPIGNGEVGGGNEAQDDKGEADKPDEKVAHPPPAPPKPPTPPGEKRKIERKIRDAKDQKDIDDALDDLFKPTGPKMTMNGIDPDKLAKAIKVVGMYMKKGVHKFADIIEDAYAKYGDAVSEIFDALKAAYLAYLNVQATDAEAAQMDTNLRGVTLDSIINTDNNDDNRPGDSAADSPNPKDAKPDNEEIISGNGGKGAGGRGGNSKGGQGSKGGKGSSDIRPPSSGEQGDNEVDKPDGGGKDAGDDAGGVDGRGNDIGGRGGHGAANGGGKGPSNTGAKSFAEKLKQQREVDNAEVKISDMANIEETLPFLLPEQQHDVKKAEDRFFGESHKTREQAFGKGMLFTNGTGTGKTYTGLGIIKRFVNSGKKKVLIVVPSSMKASDWREDGKNLGLDIHILADTKDAGKAVSVTTYANFRANQAIYDNDYDLVVYDESHRLMEDKGGNASSTTYTHYELSNKSETDAFTRLTKYHPLWVKRKELQDKIRELNKQANNLDIMDLQHHALLHRAEQHEKELEAVTAKIEAATPALKDRAKKAYQNTKVVFLSATPFKFHFNLRYANGFLYDWGDETQMNNRGSRVDAESRFYLEKFGSAYEWKYHRLQVKPMANPDAIAMQEVAFADNLMKDGAMSGRAIDSPQDYSREFPVVSGFKSEEFNRAFGEIFSYEDRQFDMLAAAARKVFFNYNYTTQLFEALKTSAALPRIQQHLDLGRKVVIFHRRQQANSTPPFRTILNRTRSDANIILKDPDIAPKERENAQKALYQADEFEAKYRDLLAYEQTLNYDSAVDQITRAFPDQVKIVNGNVTGKDKNAAVKDFNTDGGKTNILVIQEEAGKEGISLHDTTGKNPRVLMSLSMPISTTTALQIEGRIFRIGQQSNAIFEYPLLGLDLEIAYFGNNLNKRLSTTENLALGTNSRDLIRSYSEGVLNNSTTDAPHAGQGEGGKEYDKKTQEQLTPFGKAKLIYATNQKTTGTRNQRQGVDFYPTPEPLGQKMVEWADMRYGEHALEPSAGMGAIAMWVPNTNSITAIEPSFDLYSKLTARAGGSTQRVINGNFEDLAAQNKYETIVMNPPFGQAGSTAMQHVKKAFSHLREGGRMVAIVPVGNMDKLMANWLNETDDKGNLVNGNAKFVATIQLPSSTFAQAGTSVNTRVVIIDKVKGGNNNIQSEDVIYGRADLAELADSNIDLRSAKNIGELFDAIENLSMPARTVPDVAQQAPIEDNEEAPKPSEDDVVSGVTEYKHTVTGDILYKVTTLRRMGDAWKGVNQIAVSHKGKYSPFAKGWLFTNKADAEAFVAKQNGSPAMGAGGTNQMAQKIGSYAKGKNTNISVGSGVGDKEVKYPEKGEDNVDEVRDSYQPKSNEKSDPTRDYGAEYTQWEKDQLPRYAKTMQAMVDDYIRNYQFLSYDELDNLATAFSDMRKYKYQGVPQSLIDVAHAILVQTGYYKYSNPTVQKGNKEQATRLINETRKQEGIVKTPAQQMADAKAELKRAWNASGLKYDKNAGQNLGFMYDPNVDIKRQVDLFKALYNVAKLAIQQAANKLLAINAKDFIASIRGYGKLYADITDAHLTDVFNEAQKAFDAKEKDQSLVDPQMSQRTPNSAALAHDLVERVKTIYAKFGVPIAEQKLKKVRGFFQTHPEIVKISSMFNVAVGAHELMHYIIKKHAMVKQALIGSTVVSNQLKEIYVNHYPGAKDTHAEELQIEEGMTMLVNLWVQNPAYAQQMYGDAYYAMFDPAGSLYNNDVHDMALDFAEIIEDFLGLPANERIGARIRWGQPGVKKRTLHHNAYNVLKYQIYDKLYLAKDVDRMLGNEFKGSGIAPNIAMMRTAKTRMQHWFVRSRLANTRPQTPGKDGNWKEARYNTTVSDYMDLFHDKKSGLTIEEFNQMLVARRQLSDYKRLDKIDADVAAAKKMIETLEIDNTALEAQIAVETDKAILQSLKVQLSANLQNIQNLISQISELTEDALKTSDILERNRMSRPFAEEVMGLLGQRYAEPARLFDEVQANIVDMMEATGMVSAERANEWRGKDGYASFRRYFDNEEKLRETLVDAVGAKGAKQLTSLFPYKGSDLPLLPATYSQALAINEVMMKGTRNMMWQAWAMAAGNNKDVARMFRQRTSSETDKTDNIVVWMDGKKYFYQASAEVILFANAIENIQPDKFEEVGRAIAKMLQVSITGIYPFFGLTNLSIDAATRFQLSETGAIPVVHDFKTLYHMLESPVKVLVGQMLGKEFDPNIIDQYISMGGKASLNINLVNVSAEGVMKQFLAPTALDKAKLGFDVGVEALSLAVNLTELMGRATEYRRAISQGYPTNVAMMMAQNAVIDWNQKGSFGNTKGGHSMVTKLFNTIAYGFAQVTVFNQLVAGVKRHPVKSTALLTLITAVYAATQYLIYAWGDDDEKREMANQPVEMLPKFIYLPNSKLFGPESSGLTKIRIPEFMGYMGTHFALGARSAYLGGLKGANTTPKDIAYFSWKTEDQLIAGVLPPMMYPNPFVTKEGQDGRPKHPRMSAFLSSLIPTAVKTEVEVIYGTKTYPTEMPIIPNYMSTWQAKYQYDKYTTETAKALANAMGWSPKTLDYYITQKTGRGVKMIIEVGEYAFGAKDELDLYNPTQVNDRFFFSGELSNSFYDKANIAINNYKRKKNDLTVTDELATLSKLYEKGMEVLSQTSKATMTKTDKQIDALQLYLDKMEGSPKLTQEERIILKRGELTQAQKSAVFNVWAASYNDDMVALEKAIEALDALNYTDPLFDQKYETQHYINASPEAIEKQ